MATERGADFARGPDDSLVIVWCCSPENFEEVPPGSRILANEAFNLQRRIGTSSSMLGPAE
jgi:hypothetical protein